MSGRFPSRGRIRAVPTPNPQSMKFMLPLHLSRGGNYHEFKRHDLSNAHPPFVVELFNVLAWVEAVFVMENFVTLTTSDASLWQKWVPEAEAFLVAYLQSEKPLDMAQESTTQADGKQASGDASNHIAARIVKILEEYVAPAVMQDGGVVAFDSYEAGLVRVRLRGACSGCPSAMLTLKGGIERLLRNMMPDEVEAVEAVEEA